MLKISELENRQKINPVNISLAKVAAEVSETLSPIISEKSISMNLIGDANVDAEYNHMYELLKNLIENAIIYNNQNGRVTVIIESEKISVSDTGIGVSQSEQTRIFERFYRVEKSRSIKSGGTGLGLSIVKHICELYGWRLSLKSKYDVGTDVIVEF
jgi:two-component system phosphate regulon sensor histidine kinase PhoR